MALRIRTNQPALHANQYVRQNTRQVEKSLSQLASGKRIVTAGDAPADFVIAEQFNSQLKGLEQVARNTETGIAMLQTTEASLDEVNQTLATMRQLAVHAANDGVHDEITLKSDQNEFIQALNSLDRIASNTSFGNKKLLDGSNSISAIAAGKGLNFIKAGEETKSSPEKGYEVLLRQTASKSNIRGSLELTQDIINQGEEITITKDGETAVLKTSREDSVATVVEKLQQQFDEKKIDLTINGTDNILALTSTDYGSDSVFYVHSSTAGVLSLDDPDQADKFRKSNVGLDIAGTIGGEKAVGKGQILEVINNAADTYGLAVQFTGNDILSEGTLEESMSVGSVQVKQNALRFQIGAEQDQNIVFSLANVGSTYLGNNIKNASGYKSLRDINLTNLEGANSAIQLIKAATSQVAEQRGRLGAIQKHSLESTLRSVSVAIENTIASESVIRDADIAQTATELAKNQVLLNTSLAMLAQANQQPKNVLQLINSI